MPASEENAAMKSTEGGKNHDMLGLCATKLKIFKKNTFLLFELEDSLIKNQPLPLVLRAYHAFFFPLQFLRVRLGTMTY